MAQAQWPGQRVDAHPAEAAAPGLVQIVAPTPNLPTPQAPAVERHTNVETARGQQQIDQGDTSGHNFTDESHLFGQYRADPRITNYEAILPVYRAAQTAADTTAGDLDIVNAFAKMTDPTTGVREGEAASVAGSGNPTQRVQGWLNMLSGGGRLPAGQREELLHELATRGRAINRLYNSARADYIRQAHRYGFDPDAVVGSHAALPFRREIGLDSQPGQPELATGGTEIHFRGDPRRPASDFPTVAPGGREFQSAIAAAVNSGRYRTGQELIEYARTIDPSLAERLDPASVEAAVAYRRANPHGASVPVQLGMDPPAHPSIEQEGLGNPNSGAETAAAGVRGATTAFSAGLDHPAAAAYNMLPESLGGTGGSFEENLWRENNIDDYNHENHFVATVAGNLVGAAALPSGVISEARGAATATLASGGTRAEALAAARRAAGTRLAQEGAAYGAVHGAATGQGDLSDRIANGVMEAIEGGVTGKVIGRLGPSAVRVSGRDPLPPLVHPVTSRLNQPLEDASAAQRVAAAQGHGIDLPLGAATDRGGAIIEKGLDVSPVSAGLMNDARRTTEAQATGALENVAGRFGGARTMDEAGSALQSGARNWIDRFDRVSGEAYDRIPIQPTRGAILTNTQGALRRLTTIFQSNPELEQAFSNNKLNTYLRAVTGRIENVDTGLVDAAGRQIARPEQRGGALSWQDLKDFRSRIGYEIGEQRFSDSPQRDELRALYGALSEDMRATAQAQGPGALRAFERANDLYREGQGRIDNALVRILGDNSRNNPEAAAAALQTIARSGRGSSNLQQLAQIRASLAKGGEWDDVASALIRLGGQPANSEGRGFNPQTFLTWYSDMSEPARNLLFGDRGRAELRRNLDSFVEVAQRLAGTNALRNTSNTTPGMVGAGAVGGAGTAVWAGLMSPLTAVGSGAGVGANYGLARLWTNPRFVQWATGYTRMTAGAARSGAAPAEKAVAGQRSHLMRIARSNPALFDSITDLDHRLFGQSDSH